MAISWRFVATKSPQFRTSSNFEAIYWRFFQFESNKNLIWCTAEGSLSQTWRTLFVIRPKKSRQKKGESSKGSKKTWSPSEEEYLISRWAQVDCLFNKCSADYKRQETKIAARVDVQRALNNCANS